MHASLVDGRNRNAGAPSASNITQTCSARTLTLRHAFRYGDGVPFVLYVHGIKKCQNATYAI